MPVAAPTDTQIPTHTRIPTHTQGAGNGNPGGLSFLPANPMGKPRCAGWLLGWLPQAAAMVGHCTWSHLVAWCPNLGSPSVQCDHAVLGGNEDVLGVLASRASS
jgi:hypothetical protein